MSSLGGCQLCRSAMFWGGDSEKRLEAVSPRCWLWGVMKTLVCLCSSCWEVFGFLFLREPEEKEVCLLVISRSRAVAGAALRKRPHTPKSSGLCFCLTRSRACVYLWNSTTVLSVVPSLLSFGSKSKSVMASPGWEMLHWRGTFLGI